MERPMHEALLDDSLRWRPPERRHADLARRRISSNEPQRAMLIAADG